MCFRVSLLAVKSTLTPVDYGAMAGAGHGHGLRRRRCKFSVARFPMSY